MRRIIKKRKSAESSHHKEFKKQNNPVPCICESYGCEKEMNFAFGICYCNEYI